MRTKILGGFLFTLNCLFGDHFHWDDDLIRKYVHNSDTQRRWAISFMASHLRELKGDERILDIGCGDGKITADLSRFLPRGIVIGIDPCEAMLNWAKKQYCPLEYPNLCFQGGSFLQPNLIEPFDLIFSNCALQHCKDQYTALKKIAKLLKTKGKLLIIIPAFENIAWNQARANIEGLEKWRALFARVATKTILKEDEYIELLDEVGFYPKRVEKRVTVDPFVDVLEFKEFLKGTITLMCDEFYSELIDEYIRLQPESLLENGVIEFRSGKIEIEALKK